MLQDLPTKRLSALGFDPLIAPDKFSTRLDIAMPKLRYGTYTAPARVHIDAVATVEIYNNKRLTERAYSRIYEQAGTSIEPH